MAPKNVILCGLESRRVAQSSVKCKLFETSNMFGTMIGPDGHLHRRTAPKKKSSNAYWKSTLEPKAWLSGCVTSKFLRSLCWDLLDPHVHLKRQPTRSRTMLFSAQQKARTTLCRLPFSELAPNVVLVLTRWAFTPWALRLAIELQHARPHFVEALKKSILLVDTIALLFSFFSHLGERISCSFYDLQHSGCIWYCLSVRPWWHTWWCSTKKNKQKVATRLLLDKLHRQDFAGPLSSRASRVLGPISRYRVADIPLHMKIVSRASRSG